MKIEYFRTAKKSYMIIKDVGKAIESYEMKMIQNNTLVSLVQFKEMISNDSMEYWYDVSGMQPLKRLYMMKAIDEKQLRFLINHLMELQVELEEYLIDDQNVFYQLDMVFYDRISRRLKFCYLPGDSKLESEGKIKNLFEELLQYLDHGDEIAVRIGYELYERSMQSDLVIEDYRECLMMHSEIMSDDSKEEILQTDEETNESIFEKEPKKSLRKKWGKAKHKKKQSELDYSYVLKEASQVSMVAEKHNEESYTECFSDMQWRIKWELIYKEDGMERDLSLENFPFLVGSDRNNVQGRLLSRTISRIHAVFMEKDGALFVEDSNSTNGTYINGHLIPMNTLMELKDGDCIVFATEEYRVVKRMVPNQEETR